MLNLAAKEMNIEMERRAPWRPQGEYGKARPRRPHFFHFSTGGKSYHHVGDLDIMRGVFHAEVSQIWENPSLQFHAMSSQLAPCSKTSPDPKAEFIDLISDLQCTYPGMFLHVALLLVR
jgi:hypothetical protein